MYLNSGVSRKEYVFASKLRRLVCQNGGTPWSPDVADLRRS